MAKQSRLERIKRVAEAKKQKAADVTPLKPGTYWLTLRTDGLIDVWLTAPKRIGGAWISPDLSKRILTSDGIKTPYSGTWEKMYAEKEARTLPETDLECVRIGNAEPNYVE